MSPMTTFSIREAAQLIGVSDDTLRRNIDRGVLRAFRDGGHLSIDGRDLVAFQQARQAAAGLSRRELDVIAAAAEGLTTEEIATRLYISTSTVKTHLHSAQDRVGARNRVHLAVLAERAGLLG